MLFEFEQKAAPTVESIDARAKAVVIEGLFTDDDEHSYFKGRRYLTEADAIADTSGRDLVEEIRGRNVRDEANLAVDSTYWYRFWSVDKYDNESEKSAPVSATFRGAMDNDIDQTAPGQPGTPTLTNSPGDYDNDGTVEAGLVLATTAPTSGRVPRKYFAEIWRRKDTVGTTNSLSGYALWQEFTMFKVSRRFIANRRFFHKARVTPITANDVWGTSSDFTSVGIQPSTDIELPSPTTISTLIKGDRTIIEWDECTDPRYAYTRVYASTTNDSSTATRVDTVGGTRSTISDFFSTGDDIYVWLRNVSVEGAFSKRYPDPEPELGGTPPVSTNGYHVVVASGSGGQPIGLLLSLTKAF